MAWKPMKLGKLRKLMKRYNKKQVMTVAVEVEGAIFVLPVIGVCEGRSGELSLSVQGYDCLQEKKGDDAEKGARGWR